VHGRCSRVFSSLRCPLDDSGEISFDEFMEFLFSSSMLNRDLASKVKQWSSTDLLEKRRSQTGMSPLKTESTSAETE
jgi:hypothetical protein